MTLSNLSTRLKNGSIRSSRTDKSLYEYMIREFSFGKRKVAIPRTEITTEDLQVSRGPLTTNPELLIDIETASNAETEGSTRDILPRLQRIQQHTNESHIRYLEVGFRSTDSLKSAKTIFSEVCGIDINPISVAIANHRGFTTFQHNLSSDDAIPNPHYDALGCYHVLEHLHNPDVALKKYLIQ